MKILILHLIYIIGLFLINIISMLCFKLFLPKKTKFVAYFSVTITAAFLIKLLLLQKFQISDIFFLAYAFVSILVVFLLSFSEKNTEASNKKPEGSKYILKLSHEHGEIEFYNPFNNFLVYGGAGSGKTDSIGKPLLKEFIKNDFSFFIYDAKEYDYTKAAIKLAQENNYKKPIYNLDFVNPSLSYRTNIFSSKTIKNIELVPVFATTFFNSFMKPDAKKNEWYDMGLGLFKGVCWLFMEDYPEICSMPHICNFLTQSGNEKIYRLLKQNSRASNYASAFMDSYGNENTLKNIKTSCTTVIADFAANKVANYILTGNDFVLDPFNPNAPHSIAITNYFSAREIISPIVVLIFTIIAKQVSFNNQIPFVFFLDEATTFKIEDLEGYPSELREYLVAFVLLTQSSAKIEKLYSRFDRSSLESNLANQFYGATTDVIALDNYAKQFSKKDELYESRTAGTNFRNDNRSKTISTRKEVMYDGEFFSALKPGEFVGKCKNASVNKFHTRFKRYTGEKLSNMPILNHVDEKVLQDNYNKILLDIKNL